MTMQLIVTNLEDIPDDLPPGRYCCRLESMTWQEMKVRFVPGSQHEPGDCLIQMVKEGPAEPEFETLGKDATATCLAHRRRVRWLAAPCWWYHDDLPGDVRPPETRQCRSLWNAKAPIVVVRKAAPSTP